MLRMCRMNVAGRLVVTIVIVFCIFARCPAAPAADDVRKWLPSFSDVGRRSVCAIVHFPPPNQHIYCCQIVDNCQCPRRMGICAPSVSSSSTSAALSVLKRLFSLWNEPQLLSTQSRWSPPTPFETELLYCTLLYRDMVTIGGSSI